MYHSMLKDVKKYSLQIKIMKAITDRDINQKISDQEEIELLRYRIFYIVMCCWKKITFYNICLNWIQF